MRILKLLVFMLAVLGLAACAPVSPSAPAPAQVVTQVVEKVVTATPKPAATLNTQPVRGGTLNMSLGPDFATLDPFRDFEGREFKPLVYDAPVRISDKGDFEPWLAESWELSKDTNRSRSSCARA
jgi:ABC-type transport system substrate-binding protein